VTASDGSQCIPAAPRRPAVLRRLALLGCRARGPEWWPALLAAVLRLAASRLVHSAVPGRNRRRAFRRNSVEVPGPVRGALTSRATFITFAIFPLRGASTPARRPPASRGSRCTANSQSWRARSAEKKKAGNPIFVTRTTAGCGDRRRVLAQHEFARDDGADARRSRSRGNALHYSPRARRPGLLIARVGEEPTLASRVSATACSSAARGRGASNRPLCSSGERTRDVELFVARAQIPLGPINLAQLTRSPFVPVFSARLCFRRYSVRHPPIPIIRGRPKTAPLRASDRAAAQRHRRRHGVFFGPSPPRRSGSLSPSPVDPCRKFLEKRRVVGGLFWVKATHLAWPPVSISPPNAPRRVSASRQALATCFEGADRRGGRRGGGTQCRHLTTLRRWRKGRPRRTSISRRRGPPPGVEARLWLRIRSRAECLSCPRRGAPGAYESLSPTPIDVTYPSKVWRESSSTLVALPAVTLLQIVWYASRRHVEYSGRLGRLWLNGVTRSRRRCSSRNPLPAGPWFRVQRVCWRCLYSPSVFSASALSFRS